jgi:hypothetical protein
VRAVINEPKDVTCVVGKEQLDGHLWIVRRAARQRLRVTAHGGAEQRRGKDEETSHGETSARESAPPATPLHDVLINLRSPGASSSGGRSLPRLALLLAAHGITAQEVTRGLAGHGERFVHAPERGRRVARALVRGRDLQRLSERRRRVQSAKAFDHRRERLAVEREGRLSTPLEPECRPGAMHIELDVMQILE